jgi:hypothetical protein
MDGIRVSVVESQQATRRAAPPGAARRRDEEDATAPAAGEGAATREYLPFAPEDAAIQNFDLRAALDALGSRPTAGQVRMYKRSRASFSRVHILSVLDDSGGA